VETVPNPVQTLPCPPWCTVDHTDPKEVRGERATGDREHRRPVMRFASGLPPHHRDITVDVMALDVLEGEPYRDGPYIAIYGAELLSPEQARRIAVGLVEAAGVLEPETSV